MISMLRGRIFSVRNDQLVMDVGGVGYCLTCSAVTLAALRDCEDETLVLVETHVREDAIRLYGFLDEEERTWFRILMGVQGVGAKIALSLLGTLGVDGLAAAVTAVDADQLKRADGVGGRLATRIATELAGKIPPAEIGVAGAAEVASAQAALMKLGFKSEAAKRGADAAVQQLPRGAGVEEIVREALKAAARVQPAA